MDCIFCKIINKEIPSYTLYEDDLVLAFLDINQENLGHTLIIPKKHFESIYEVDLETLKHMYKVANNLSKNILNKLNKDGFSYVINYGSMQEVKHLHLHICPVNNEINIDSLEELQKILLEK